MRVLWLLPALLVACGPIPVERAEQQCFERARLAQQPRGMVSVGAVSDGRTAVGAELTITSDYIMGRDPSAVYDLCVQQKSGQPPTRPLYSFPEWRG